MKEITTNLPTMSIKEFKNSMLPIYANFIKMKMKLPAIMLWGSPGVGKSDGIKQIAKELAEKTGRTAHVTDVRLLLFNPVDLRGIPTADEKKEFSKWLKPHIFNMDDSEDIVNFLVLDEITAAPQSVQAAAYQIVLDRQIGEHKLPDNCIVIAAGNKITDKSVAYSMPKALCNRMTHIEIEANVESWKDWAYDTGIDSRIIGFINYKPNSLFSFDPSSQDQAYPTPRTWEMVDKYLKVNNNVDVIRPIISGTIGLGACTEFIAFCKTYNKLPDIKDIANGKYKEYPTAPDINYALSAAIVNFVINSTVKVEAIKNIFEYCTNMQAEFAVLTIKELLGQNKIREKLTKSPEVRTAWIEFTKKYKEYVV